MNTAERIFQDLLHLEISLIVKSGMTARKMPEPWHAVLDIIGEFNSYMCAAAAELNEVWESNGKAPIRVRPPDEDGSAWSIERRAGADGTLTTALRQAAVREQVSVEALDELREWAVNAEAVHRHALNHRWTAPDDVGPVLKRIYRNCDQLKGILSRPDVHAVLGHGAGRSGAVAIPFTPDELITIRKIWEVGTESVVMQTVVQLDGDVVTRVQAGREKAGNDALYELHRQAVGTALSHWQFLAQTVATFLTSALRGFFLGSGRS